MKKYTLIFILPFLFLAAKAETKNAYTLHWKGISYLDAALSDQRVVSFDDAVLKGDNYLPYFVTRTDLEASQKIDSVVVINAMYADFTPDEILLMKLSSAEISEKPSAKISYSTERKQQKALVTLLPIIREQGRYRKIISFELKYYFSDRSLLRAARVSGAHQYVANSVLSSGKWVKISVDNSGIYKISYDDLVQWGISNPANAHIFGYGGAILPEDFSVEKIDDLPQLAVWKEKGTDGIFNSGDYMLFYAQGPVSWKYNEYADIFNREINPYSFLGYYFITSDAGVEKTIDLQPIPEAGAIADFYSFLDYKLYEEETRNLYMSGKDWFGKQFNKSNASYSFSFSFPNIDTNRQAVISLNAAADKPMSIYLNGILKTSLSLSRSPSSYNYNKNYFFTPETEDLTVRLQYSSASSSDADLNFLAVNAYRQLIMTGDVMPFRCPNSNSSINWGKFHLQGQANLKIWKITDKLNIQQLPTSFNGAEHTFIDDVSVLNEYVAVNTSGSFPKPTKVGLVSNQNLHAVPQADLVIITPAEYWAQANTLAKLHQDKDGLSVLVVTSEQVYNEFSSGTPDATAYRWLMKMLYDRAATEVEAPKYLLLFGDGTYDNRGIINANTLSNKLLTYQSTISLGETQSWVSDDYFGFLDDNEMNDPLSALLDVAVGRLPVSTSQQATDIVNKITNYLENKNQDYWKNLFCYIGDDKDADTSEELALHMAQANAVATYVETNYPWLQPKRILYDAFVQEERANGESYPQAKEMFTKLLNSGVFMVNYTGHSNMESLSSERILFRDDVKNMHNKKYPILFTASCEFGRFDGSKSGTAEESLLKSDGGFIAVVGAARTVYSDKNFDLHKKYMSNLYEAGKPLALGEILRKAKNAQNYENNKMSYVLLGDPALIPPMPQNRVKVTSLSSNSNVVQDTIKALSAVTVKGHIESMDGNTMSNFTGKLYAVVYDKKNKITQLLNTGNIQRASDTIFYYYDRPNVLFSGTTTVKNGEFTLQFMVPKDIAYNYGAGRINFYATDAANALEAQGYYEDFKVGGMKSDFVFENQGPTIDMYLNVPEFRSGCTVDANSTFIAKLYDENGINVTGSSVGHDLLLTLNNDKNMSYVLNDYYETDADTYKSGSVAYKLPTLAEGNYTLTLRAWDLLNNSTTKSINFKVSNEIKPAIYDFYATPNPADKFVKFVLVHDQPFSKLDIDISIYDLNGKIVLSDKKSLYSEGDTSVYDWDLIDSTGARVPKGMYLYRISVSSDDGALVSKTNKLIVK